MAVADPGSVRIRAAAPAAGEVVPRVGRAPETVGAVSCR